MLDVVPVALSLWAEAERRCGQPDRANEIATEAAGLLEHGSPSLLNEAPIYLALHDACVDLGRPAEAKDAIKRGLPRLVTRVHGLSGTPHAKEFLRHLAPNAGLIIPWTRPDPTAIKGVVHVPSHNTPMTPSRRDALLIALAKARQWVDDVALGRAAGFAAIARREGKAERHVRLLAPLAFVSPRIVAAILDGTAPERLTASALARALPWAWDEQERQVGLEAAARSGG